MRPFQCILATFQFGVERAAPEASRKRMKNWLRKVGDVAEPSHGNIPRDAASRLIYWQREFGYGRRVSKTALRNLIKSRRLPREARIEACVLLGEVLAGENNFIGAQRSFDKALRFRPLNRGMIYTMKAQAFAEDGPRRALALLEKVKPRTLDVVDRQIYWMIYMDVATAAGNIEVLHRVVNMVWKRDQQYGPVAAARSFAKSFLRLCNSRAVGGINKRRYTKDGKQLPRKKR